MSIKSKTNVGVLLLAFFPVLQTVAASAQELSDEVRSALAYNAESLSPITIQWTDAIVLAHPTDPGQTRTLMQKGKFTWQDAMFRSEDEIDRSSLKSEHVSARRVNKLGFNGKILFFDSGTGVRNSPVDTYIKGDPHARLLQVYYFDAAGIYLPSKNAEIPSARLQSQILFQLENGGQVESVETATGDDQTGPLLKVSIIATNVKWQELDARDTTDTLRKAVESGTTSEATLQQAIKRRDQLLKNTPQKVRFVYHLAGQLGYAVVRCDQFTMENEKMKECVNSSFEEVAQGDVWLPTTVRVAEFEQETESHELTYQETPLQTHTYTLSSIEHQSYPEGYFTLSIEDIEAGRRVIDDMNPDARLADGKTAVYIMPADLSDLDNAIARAVKGRPTKRKAWSPVRWLLIGNGLLLIAFAVSRIVLKWRKSSPK